MYEINIIHHHQYHHHHHHHHSSSLPLTSTITSYQSYALNSANIHHYHRRSNLFLSSTGKLCWRIRVSSFIMYEYLKDVDRRDEQISYDNCSNTEWRSSRSNCVVVVVEVVVEVVVVTLKNVKDNSLFLFSVCIHNIYSYYYYYCCCCCGNSNRK